MGWSSASEGANRWDEIWLCTRDFLRSERQKKAGVTHIGRGGGGTIESRDGTRKPTRTGRGKKKGKMGWYTRWTQEGACGREGGEKNTHAKIKKGSGHV